MNRISIVEEGEVTTVRVPRQTVRWNGCPSNAVFFGLFFLGLGGLTLYAVVERLFHDWHLFAVAFAVPPLLGISLGGLLFWFVLESGVREATVHIRRGEVVVVRPRRFRGPLVRRITRSEFLGTMISWSTCVDGASLVEMPLGTLPPFAKVAEPGEEEPNVSVVGAMKECLTITRACAPEDAMWLSRRIHTAFEP